MQEIVFVTKFYCEICKSDRPLHVYGNGYSRVDRDRDKKYQEEVVKWGKYYHWINYHRICAVCGELVVSGELDLLENDRGTEIHRNYTDEYKKVESGDRFGPLLIVHEKCAKEGSRN